MAECGRSHEIFYFGLNYRNTSSIKLRQLHALNKQPIGCDAQLAARQYKQGTCL